MRKHDVPCGGDLLPTTANVAGTDRALLMCMRCGAIKEDDDLHARIGEIQEALTKTLQAEPSPPQCEYTVFGCEVGPEGRCLNNARWSVRSVGTPMKDICNSHIMSALLDSREDCIVIWRLPRV